MDEAFGGEGVEPGCKTRQNLLDDCNFKGFMLFVRSKNISKTKKSHTYGFRFIDVAMLQSIFHHLISDS